MLFIHNSEIKCHGNLTSANCVVDSRFTLKITDFGLPMLQMPNLQSEDKYYRSTFSKQIFLSIKFCKNELKSFKKKEQLWRAPELQVPYTLACTNSYSSYFLSNQKGDVYSFAVIVQEIFYRKGVFYLNEEDKESIRINGFSINDSPKENSYLCDTVKITNKGFFC